MPLQIAILGWGSLLWERAQEFDRRHDAWRHDGPSLKLEFSRVSVSRLRALTLVIDATNGVPTTVAWCLSTRKDPGDAIADLRCREGTTLKNIRHICLTDFAGREPDGEPERDIVAWARRRELDLAVWTALSSNFATKVKLPFSVSNALAHLKNLSPEAKVKAAEYIWRAPQFVQTPLRTAVEAAAWFP